MNSSKNGLNKVRIRRGRIFVIILISTVMFFLIGDIIHTLSNGTRSTAGQFAGKCLTIIFVYLFYKGFKTAAVSVTLLALGVTIRVMLQLSFVLLKFSNALDFYGEALLIISPLIILGTACVYIIRSRVVLDILLFLNFQRSKG